MKRQFARNAGVTQIRGYRTQRKHRDLLRAAVTEVLEERRLLSSGSPTDLVPVANPNADRGLWAPVTVQQSAPPDLAAISQTLPSSFDLRSVGGVTSVKDQGQCGSCWAFATYGSAESAALVASGTTLDLSENNLKDWHGFDWGPCDGGNSWISEAYLSRGSGPVSEATDPYHDYDDRGAVNPGYARSNWITQMLRYDTADEMKNAVMTKGALDVSMYWDDTAYRSSDYTYYYTGSGVNHDVTLVGWDDAKVTAAATPGAWLIKNSWGSGWGNNGYFWLSYADSIGAKAGESFGGVVPASTYNNAYYWDDFGDTSELNSPWAMNRYVSQRNENVNAVGFFTEADNAGYTVSIYDTLSGGALSGLLSTTSGTQATAGWHTLTLPSSVHLTAGNDFYVVVAITNGGTYPQAFDSMNSGYDSASTAAANQSWYSFDGTSWTDLTSFNSTANFCVKAYTVSDPISGPDLVGSQLAIASRTLVSGSANLTLGVMNQGSQNAGAFNVRFYLSDDSVIDPATDTLLSLSSSDPHYNAASPSNYRISAVNAGQTYSGSVLLVCPSTDPFNTDGAYTIGMVVDTSNEINETATGAESNNRNRGEGLDWVQVAYTLSNSSPITILDASAATPYPSTIQVSGLSGTVTDINVILHGISHTWPDDIDVLLVGPGGQKVILMSDCGGSYGLTNVTLTLDDEAAASLPDTSQISSGTFRPTDFQTGDVFTSPAPAGPYSALLSAFDGSVANGTWSLYVMDDMGGDSGTISGGWEIVISTAPVALGEIHGSEWNDLDGDGVQDTGEPALANWRVYLDANTNGQWDTGETSVLTDASGNYAFVGLSAGTYTVGQVLQSGWTQTCPAGAVYIANPGPSTIGTAEQLSTGVVQAWSQNSGATAPESTSSSIVTAYPQSAYTLSQVPTSTWTYGCSATSAGMMLGYYDRTGYPNMYTGPANGGVAPLTDLGQGDIPSSPIAGACSLIATQNGFDGRITPGHVDDYWSSYGASGPDPWEASGVQHTWGGCLADYMGTNQWKWDFDLNGSRDTNTDGSTVYFSAGASKLYDYIPPSSYGMPQTELCHGMRLFAESRGYTVVENYTQAIDTVAAGGFSFLDYQTEINAGRPVMIQVAGHSMVGFGYDVPTQTIYLHDTWDNAVHSMTWGGSYSGMAQQAVTVFHLAPGAALPGMYTVNLSAGEVATGLAFGNHQANSAPVDIGLSGTSVAENLALATTVGTFNTTDPDAGNTFTYTLVSGTGSTDNASFTIAGGTLQTAAIFNYEAKSSYTIRVRSTDQGGLFFEKAFTISVTNVNETPSDIALSASSIAENQASATAVGTLTTTDPDAGNTFTYTLVTGTGSADNASFTIAGGILKTAAAFNYEAKSSYAIRVRSTDQGGLFFEKAFTISVTNVNETPSDIALSASSIAENQASATAVGTLTTTDPDAGNTFTYTLVTGTGSADNASFTIAGGILQTAASFNYEAKSSYAVRVRTTDQGGLFFEKAFVITVTNVRETTIAGRQLFYNHSTFDGNNPAANASDDAAIAADKSALLPGHAATFANYSSYSRGLNGIMLDLGSFAGTLSAADFTFKVGNNNTPSGWATAPAPTSITQRAIAGGVTRVTLIWADNAIQKQWLQVTLVASVNSDLAANDVFYFGNAIADTGNAPANAIVNSTDEALVKNHQSGLSTVGIGNLYDLNRDTRVNSSDLALVRNNKSGLTPLLLISAPAGSGSAMAPSGQTAAVATRLPLADAAPAVASDPAPSWSQSLLFPDGELNDSLLV